jgi:hypothetical protein
VKVWNGLQAQYSQLGGCDQAEEDGGRMQNLPENYEGATDPARAFADLRAEIAVLRRAVEALPAARQESQQLAGLIGTARQRSAQRTRLIRATLAAFVVGLLVAPLVAGALPFGLNGRVAAFITKADHGQAGAALMHADISEDWREVANAAHLMQANQREIAACRETAARVRQDARCTITVPAIPEE